MPRPQHCRRVAGLPPCRRFKPAGVPGRTLPESVLTLDEYEAFRLADGEGLYHEQAAKRMGVSRPTFGRVLESARKKVAQALAEGWAIRIEGGEVAVAGQRAFACPACRHAWQEPYGTGRPLVCPRCGRGPVGRTHPGPRGGGGRGDRGAGRPEPAAPPKDGA